MPPMCLLPPATSHLRKSPNDFRRPSDLSIPRPSAALSRNHVIRLYYTTDHLGSVREMLDSGGTVRASYDYSPEGRRTKVSGDLDSDFGFTGHYTHNAVGLVAAPYRFYNPFNQRWLSRDPIEEKGGIALYGYVNNSPASFTDPLGYVGESDYGHPPGFWKWVERSKQKDGQPPDHHFSKEEADKLRKEWEDLGRPDPTKFKKDNEAPCPDNSIPVDPNAPAPKDPRKDKDAAWDAMDIAVLGGIIYYALKQHEKSCGPISQVKPDKSPVNKATDTIKELTKPNANPLNKLKNLFNSGNPFSGLRM